MRKMKQIMLSTIVALVVLTTISCKGKKDVTASVNEKKVQLEKLKSQSGKTAEEIKKLQDELALTDSNTANAAKIKLVAVAPVTIQNFTHYIDLQGKVDANNISYISPRGMGGQVRAVYVQQGQAPSYASRLLRHVSSLQASEHNLVLQRT